MREIILDTETTGFHAKGADRIIEIACLEVVDKRLTNNSFHTYVNPLRDVPLAATKIHNIKTSFLTDKPTFDKIGQKFLDFVGDSPLIIHNAPFDIGFLNAELDRHAFRTLPMDQTIDTLVMARSKFPGSNNTLDGLCKRFKVDLTNRDYHGALIDCELLFQVYIELIGGRQKILFSNFESNKGSNILHEKRIEREQRFFPPSDEEIKQHEEFLKTFDFHFWKSAS